MIDGNSKLYLYCVVKERILKWNIVRTVFKVNIVQRSNGIISLTRIKRSRRQDKLMVFYFIIVINVAIPEKFEILRKTI